MNRVLIKMSGESVVNVDDESIISAERLDAFSEQIAQAREERRVEILVVVGGGNILRGKALHGVERTKLITWECWRRLSILSLFRTRLQGARYNHV